MDKKKENAFCRTGFQTVNQNLEYCRNMVEEGGGGGGCTNFWTEANEMDSVE